ncbi:unnamed protein product [Zymoseptoria tritici ST99CH_1A5]|uniref:F-box domain-containing protein n=1 Tax=Zymoseptoria tritici ST99CH_1A5 TaxID=1276529 RepID=A0A1Y6LFJ6_ZYMTR|nr:unnamed protein product [Zymoseptoria tritici ST99CH_1A5]
MSADGKRAAMEWYKVPLMATTAPAAAPLARSLENNKTTESLKPFNPSTKPLRSVTRYSGGTADALYEEKETSLAATLASAFKENAKVESTSTATGVGEQPSTTSATVAQASSTLAKEDVAAVDPKKVQPREKQFQTPTHSSSPASAPLSNEKRIADSLRRLAEPTIPSTPRLPLASNQSETAVAEKNAQILKQQVAMETRGSTAMPAVMSKEKRLSDSSQRFATPAMPSTPPHTPPSKRHTMDEAGGGELTVEEQRVASGKVLLPSPISLSKRNGKRKTARKAPLNILDFPQELLEDILEPIGNEAVGGPQTLGFLQSCKFARNVGMEAALRWTVFVSTFNMALYGCLTQKFFRSLGLVRCDMGRHIRKIEFKLSNIDLSSFYTVCQIGLEFSRDEAFYGLLVQPPTPVVQYFPSSRIGEDSIGCLISLDKARRMSFPLAWDDHDISLSAYDIGIKSIEIQFDVGQMHGPDEDEALSVEVRSYLYKRFFQGIQHISMVYRKSSAEYRKSMSANEHVFLALKHLRGVPESYKTAFWWFRERHLRGEDFGSGINRSMWREENRDLAGWRKRSQRLRNEGRIC